MQNLSPLGLREWKKLDTALRIQRVAIDLAIAQGSDSVTVDEICAGSRVSMRTFFNYFPTKETAILGKGLELIHGREIRELLDAHPHDLLRGVVAVLDRCFSASEAEPELLLRRKTLMEAQPHLVPRQMLAFDRFEQDITLAVGEWLDENPLARHTDQLPAQDEARLTVLLAGTVVRGSITRWVMGSGDETRASIVESTIIQLAQIVTKQR